MGFVTPESDHISKLSAKTDGSLADFTVYLAFTAGLFHCSTDAQTNVKLESGGIR